MRGSLLYSFILALAISTGCASAATISPTIAPEAIPGLSDRAACAVASDYKKLVREIEKRISRHDKVWRAYLDQQGLRKIKDRSKRIAFVRATRAQAAKNQQLLRELERKSKYGAPFKTSCVKYPSGRVEVVKDATFGDMICIGQSGWSQCKWTNKVIFKRAYRREGKSNTWRHR